jgi:hypothetical protein|tara:strand:+ start:405 stop:569 length:165 start_codon:yes stop_codon:yes gene_type:complete
MMYVNREYSQAQFEDYNKRMNKQIKEDVIEDFFRINEAVVNHKKQLHHDPNEYE